MNYLIDLLKTKKLLLQGFSDRNLLDKLFEQIILPEEGVMPSDKFGADETTRELFDAVVASYFLIAILNAPVSIVVLTALLEEFAQRVEQKELYPTVENLITLLSFINFLTLEPVSLKVYMRTSKPFINTDGVWRHLAKRTH